MKVIHKWHKSLKNIVLDNNEVTSSSPICYSGHTSLYLIWRINFTFLILPCYAHKPVSQCYLCITEYIKILFLSISKRTVLCHCTRFCKQSIPVCFRKNGENTCFTVSSDIVLVIAVSHRIILSCCIYRINQWQQVVI